MKVSHFISLGSWSWKVSGPWYGVWILWTEQRNYFGEPECVSENNVL